MRHTAALGKSEFAGRRGWGRRLWRSAVAMAAILALAGSLIVATERADAQSSTTFVTNLDNIRWGTIRVGLDTRPDYQGIRDTLAINAFRTGTEDHGYGLVSVTLHLELSSFHSGLGTPVPEVTINSDANGFPGPVLFNLANPSNIDSLNFSVRPYTFDAQAQAWLAPNTTYWLAVSATDAILAVAQTEYLDEEDGKMPGWSIGDGFFYRSKNSNSSWIARPTRSLMMQLDGVVFSPTKTEPSDWEFPYQEATWGYVDEFSVGGSSTGRLDEPVDVGTRANRYRRGDWWKLNVEHGRRYRVEVAISGASAASGGGIDVNGRGDLWDHFRDDGRAFIEFTEGPEPYYLQVRAKDFLNAGSAEYYGPYEITLTDITGITKKVSNTRANSGNKIAVTSTNWKAVGFRAGDNTGGYALSYVGTGLHDKTGISSVKAELWTNNSGSPGTKIFDFERISAITGHPTAQYTDRFWAPLNAANLDAETVYWVVFKEMNSGAAYEVPKVNSSVDNPGAASGWIINASTLQYDTTATSPSWSIFDARALLLEVFAASVGSPSATVDSTAPLLDSATMDGYTLTLAYDEALDATAMPPSSAFTVNVDGSPRTVRSVVVDQSDVRVYVFPQVESGNTVTVDYTVPTDVRVGRVQDTSGNEAASLSGQAVTNSTTSSGGGGGGGGGGGRSDEQDPPGVPESLDVARQQSGQLKAAWTAPGSGPAPTGYTVQWKAAVDAWEDPDDVSEAVVAGTSHTITGLTDGVEYAARVVATRDGADSAPSEEVTAMPQETTPPELSSASVDGAELTLTFNEALDTDMMPHTSAFAVTVAGGSRGVDAVTVSDSEVSLTLVTAVSAGDAVTVDYTAPAGESAPKLQDQVGNAAASFSGQSLTNHTPAGALLTASTHDVPANHDGRTTFTFELRFSENPRKGFSYKTLRDHAFTVTGGEVVKARRLEKGKNVRWEISVTPNGDGPVTVVLPVTTDCTAQGAICTQDGRMLSQGFELTVPGLSMPEITSGSSFSMEEGATEVATLRATDNADTDGVYEVTVQVSDGGRTDSADAGSDQADVEQGAAVALSRATR